MISPLSPILNLPLSDHEVRLFYELPAFDLDAGPTATIGNLDPKASGAKHPVLPDDQAPAVAGRYKEQAIWAPLGHPDASIRKWSSSNDLHPAIQELISGDQPTLARYWGMTREADRLLQTAALNEANATEISKTKRLVLALREAGEARITAAGVSPAPVTVSLSDLSIVGFATGIAICCVSVQIERGDKQPVSSIELMEALYAFSRQNNLFWALENKLGKPVSKPFSLGELVRSFAQGTIDGSVRARRADSYVFAQFANDVTVSAIEALSVFMARRYTTDYALNVENCGVDLLKDFDNIRHAVSAEGAATVLSVPADQTVRFLQNWRTDSFASVYARLYLMALQEDLFLTQSRAVSLEVEPEDNALSEMEDLVESALVFRLCFRFFGVSKLSMHSRFSHALRHARFLDRKLEEFEKDIAAMTERLSAARQEAIEAKEQERFLSYSNYALVGGAFLAGLTTFTIVKEVLDVFPAFLADVLPAINPGVSSDASTSNTSGQLAETTVRRQLPLYAGAFITVFSLVIGFMYRPQRVQPTGSKTQTFRVMALKMMRRALR